MLFSFEDMQFFSNIFGQAEKRLDLRAMVNFKIYDFRNWKKLITMHILPNISRSKDNQTIKFNLLV